jgi:hypothetical protein
MLRVVRRRELRAYMFVETFDLIVTGANDPSVKSRHPGSISLKLNDLVARWERSVPTRG